MTLNLISRIRSTFILPVLVDCQLKIPKTMRTDKINLFYDRNYPGGIPPTENKTTPCTIIRNKY